MHAHRKKFRLVVGSDGAGREYGNALAADMRASELVASVIDIGLDGQTRSAYPEVAIAAGKLIADCRADRALLVCHTGLGMAIAANKVRGVRAVTAHDPLSVRASVLSNNAQVLALGQGVIGLALARRLTVEWLAHHFDDPPSAVAKLGTIRAFEYLHSPAECPPDQPH
ncbi:RpiB/LacA/LacB family sugar-phosphate isomerase [Streptomyces sp. NPDC005955]|uniref:RpiB/LacA/LacB family sugar-phosphate isomerase n=1 Tax=Streptomyces sp. NPDC005955 TaxID=3364738 RepID=UPI0036B7BE4D